MAGRVAPFALARYAGTDMGSAGTSSCLRVTRRTAAACLLALAFAATGRASADDGWARWPLPLAEAEWVVTRWFASTGFEVTRSPPEAGVVRLSGTRGSERRDVLLRPCSALATCVHPGDAPDAAREKELSELLTRHLGGATLDRPLPDSEVPKPVLARKAAAVCIDAQQRGRVLRSSGFGVDGDGQLLTTAHDLEGIREVTVLWEDGRKAKARLVRVDPERDLALLRVAGPVPAAVPLRGARGVLEDGEEVFSIGCPSGVGETIRSGRVRTPMKRVGSLRLWEVEIESLPGGSGSPLFDASGHLAGVVKGRLRGTETTGFVIPVEVILRFLEGR